MYTILSLKITWPKSTDESYVLSTILFYLNR